MTFQGVTHFLRQVPHYGYQTVNHVRRGSVATATWAKNHLATLWAPENRPSFVNRIHELYIQPLDLTDGLIFSVCGCVAVGVMVTAIAIFGKPFIAPAVLAGCVIMLVSAKITKDRITAKFNEEAAQIVTDIIRVVNEGPPSVQTANQADQVQNDAPSIPLEEIATLRGQLRAPENAKFEHLKEDLDRLDTQISEYRKDMLHPSDRVDPDAIKKTFIADLIGLRNKLRH